MKWIKTAIDPAQVREMARRYEIDLLTSTILCRRGITAPGQVRFFLQDELRGLHNPFQMPAMAEAVERINAAVDSGEKILIFGDRDVDGVTATVLLFEALREMDAQVDWMLPEGEDSYGLSPAVIERAVAAGIGLLVTVDCGVSNAAEIELAGSFGIDTVVIDHHNPPPDLPPAAAVVNPKLPGYPFRDLCGCAVASKVEWALRFARSAFYGAPLCLLNARPANETIVVEAVRLCNLAQTGRITESFVPGLVPFEKTRLAAFLGAEEALVLDAPAQARLLEQAFGPGVGIGLSDIAPLISQFLPGLAGRSLLRIQQSSRSAAFSETPPTEMDTLVQTFVSLVLAREEERLAPAFARLDLVTLGTLADLMPLVDENRTLVRRGLGILRASERDGLRQLFRRKDLLGKRITTSDIAWQVSPLLNSAGRMGEPGTATRALIAPSPAEAEPLVEQLFQLDGRRRSMGENAWNIVREKAQESLERSGGRCVMVHDERIQRGITGIIASRLQVVFKVPSIVVSVGADSAVGSIRSNRPHVISDFFGRHREEFQSFGGHDFAGGFSMGRDRLDGFVSSFFEHSEEFPLPEAVDGESLTIDAEIPLALLKPDLQKTVDLLEPFGEGNPPLAFLTRGMRVANCELIGKKDLAHLKLLLEAGPTRWPAVYWNAAARFPGDFTIGDTVDVVYRLGRNTYGGGENLQLTIVDMESARGGASSRK
ncbi:MAG TPA: single-stranded-DNA-specific exonuclease RecJ [Spirochaetia bacterium]|nr:single-stranded-DNA-specific exonuclease RecJ [Spirochaetia bacterium]